MKRFVPVLTLSMLFMLFIIAPMVFAADSQKPVAFRFGAGISVSGYSNAHSGVELNAVFRPFSLNVANPFFRLETGLSFGKGDFLYSGFKAMAGLELFRTMWNPLAFTMINKGPWSPAMSFGVITESFSSVEMLFEFSPFRVLDKDFIYEWFPVFGVFDGTRFDSWGVYLFRFTSMF